MIDMTKQYKTRSGSSVRLFANDGGGECPILGAVCENGDEWDPESWTENGEYFSDSDGSEMDLIEVKPEPKAIPFSEIPVGAYFTYGSDTGSPYLKTSPSIGFGLASGVAYPYPETLIGRYFVVRPTAPIEWERV